MYELINIRPHFQKIGKHHIHSLQYTSPKPGGYRFVLLHGLGASSHTFLPLINYLAPQASSIYAPDLPAHGLSARFQPPLDILDAYDDMAKCLQRQLKITGPAIIIGNSLGGAFAAKFALQCPQLVSSLFLISPAGAPFTTPIDETLNRFRPQNLAQAKQTIDDVHSEKYKFTALLAPAFMLALKNKALNSLINSIDNRICFTPNELVKLQTPTYLLWGQKDPILPNDQRIFYQKHLPQLTCLDTTAKYSHCPHHDFPTEVASKILDFAAATTAKQRAPEALTPSA